MSSQARFLRDSTIEILTNDGDRLILSSDEARKFQIEVENALYSLFHDDQTDLESQIPIVANDMSFSLEDAEQLASSLDELLSREGRGPNKKIDWLRVGY